MKKVAVAIHAIKNFTPEIIKGLKGLDYIHVDVMDGKFVNNTNINLEVFKILKENVDIPVIAHLMVFNPFDYIKKVINNIDIFLFHFESDGNKDAIINEVKKYNKKVGFAINPSTKISEIISYLEKLDIILIMGVNPGWSGQKFIPNTINKVNKLTQYKKEYEFLIDVDGGLTLENAKQLINTDILTSSSSILYAEDPNLVIQKYKESDKNG